MIPILYSKAETVAQLVADKTNGVGRLADATSCKVQEDRNGAFTLSMTYPISGIHYADIVIGGCIKAKPNELADPQLFRIYHISKPLNGMVTIDAQHLSYDLSKAVVKPFSAKGITTVTSGMISNMIGGIGFSFSSDINNGDSQFTNDHPQSFRALLGGQEGSVLDVFGGEYEFNNEKVILHAHRGSDNGVVIRYGKNLTSVQQDENIESTYTAVYPYVLNSDQETIAGDLQTVVSTSEPKILALDLSSEFKEEDGTPTAAQINAKAQEYIKANNIGVPKVSLDVSFVQLWQTEEYKDIAPLERVSLCDTVTVKYEKLGVDATAKVITTVYDVLAERYDSITLGDAKSSLASTIAAAPDRNEIQKQASSDLERAVTRATNLITGQKGGHVVIKSDANGKPQELLIMDTEDEATATKVWRWNLSGLGYSSKGINGEYGTAITQDGEIVADFITTGDLNSQVITTGILKDRQGNNSWNLDTGELSLHAYETKTDASSKLTSANSHTDNALKSYYNKSEIDITANGIKSSVSSLATTVSENDTKAQGYADTAESNANSHTDDALKSYSTTVEMNSAISQSADSISSKVSKTYVGKSSIISEINQSAESIKISADKVAIETSDFTFGKAPSTVTMKTNSGSTGVSFEGSGTVDFNTKGRYKAVNVNANSGENGSLLNMYNSGSNNSLIIQNYKESRVGNQIELKSNDSTFGTYLRLTNYNYANSNMANTILWYSNTKKFNAFYLENYKADGTGIANQIFIASDFTKDKNTLTLKNFQFSNSSVVNGMIEINDNVTIKAQNWLAFYACGGDRRVVFKGLQKFEVNGVDILAKLNIAAQGAQTM